MKRAIFCFGRFNPPTHGHGKVFDYLFREAAKQGADVWVFISPTQDTTKNPLSHAERKRFLKVGWPKLNVGPPVKLITLAIDSLLAKGYTDITLMGGADRTASFASIARYYNRVGEGKTRMTIGEVPRPQGAVSATIARRAAVTGKFNEFMAALAPSLRNKTGEEIYTIIRQRLSLREAATMRSFMQFRESVEQTQDLAKTPEEKAKLEEPSTVIINPPVGVDVSNYDKLPDGSKTKLSSKE